MPRDSKTSPEEKETELVPSSDPRFGVVSINPERLGGTPCFAGTRVPIQSLFNHLAAGDSLDAFLDDFEGVPRSGAVSVLEIAAEKILDGLPKVVR